MVLDTLDQHLHVIESSQFSSVSEFWATKIPRARLSRGSELLPEASRATPGGAEDVNENHRDDSGLECISDLQTLFKSGLLVCLGLRESNPHAEGADAKRSSRDNAEGYRSTVMRRESPLDLWKSPPNVAKRDGKNS